MLGEKAVELNYRGAWQKSDAERIYLLDQEFARAGIPYTAELIPGRWNTTFRISVPESQRDKATAIIAELEQRDRPQPVPPRVDEEPAPAHHQSMLTITPADLPAHLQDHPWEFALFSEYDNPHSFLGKLLYQALVFRNKKHTIYGIKEWHDPGAPIRLDKMARRIVVDEDFRNSLVTDDPRVPEIWEKLGLLPRI